MGEMHKSFGKQVLPKKAKAMAASTAILPSTSENTRIVDSDANESNGKRQIYDLFKFSSLK